MTRRDAQRRSTKRVLRRAGARCTAFFCVWSATVLAQDQVPRFRSSVDVTSVDVTVLGDDGRAVEDLTPDDFTVTIDDVPRQVVSAEWIPLGTPEADEAKPLPAGYSTNEGALGGRLIVLVVDQPNIHFGGVQSLQSSLFEFIDRLPLSDRIAVIGIGPGAQATPFTTDRQAVKDAIGQMPGGKAQAMFAQYNIAVTEALDVYRGRPFTLDRVVERECMGLRGLAAEACAEDVQKEAVSMAIQADFDGRTTLDGLRGLLRGLQSYDAPKTLVLVSEGFHTGDSVLPLDQLEQLCAEAQTSVYALQLDARRGDGGRPTSGVVQMLDRNIAGDSLSALTSASRGALFNVSASATGALRRIEAELSGYYLVGVESDPADRAYGSRDLSIRVKRGGLTVRSRRRLFGDSTPASAQSLHERVGNALSLPLTLSGLPLKVATFSLRGPDSSKVQLLIHADIGEDYTASRPVVLGYVISDADGRIVDSQGKSVRLRPVMDAVPSPLQFTGGASLDPGAYTLKLAVADGDRIGSIEHPVRAGLTDAGDVILSDLTVGGPPGTSDVLWPTVGPTVSFGIVHGYIEAYGARAADVSTRFEIAVRADSPALLSGEVAPSRVGEGRVIFTDMIVVRQLPPGWYVLRATMSMTLDGDPLEIDTMTREFEVAPPAVLLTAADSVVPPRPSVTELFLPVTDTQLRRPFKIEEVARPETLEVFRALVAPEASEAFERGVSLLAAGEYGAAEQALKSAINVETDSTAPMAYLAAVFAAAGHDVEAAGVWQTALIEGSDRPEIYSWLGDALLRSGGFRQARFILEEANDKWPGDTRFLKPLAMLYATLGQGREAVRTLRRYLDGDPDDMDALALGVEWIYFLHSEDHVAYSPSEDREIAQSWANVYDARGGADAALVWQWIGAVEGSAP